MSATGVTGVGAVELSVVMPCLNEAETLETCIRKALRSIEDLSITGEVLIADNGSTDGSQEIARRCGARVVDIAARGYGAALRGGLDAARGEFVIMGDADDSYDFTNLGPFLERLRAGDELVMGNRFKGGIEPGAMPKLHRYLGNPVLSTVGRMLFRVPCGDFHCGLRGFRRDAIRALDLRTTGMEFASEMVVKATLHDLRISEVPTTLSPDGRSRPPHLRSWHDGWRHLRFLLLFSPRWLFLIPGLLLMVSGTSAGTVLLIEPVAVGDTVFDVQTLLYAAVAVIVGFQAVVFAVFTKAFAINEGLLPADARLERWFERITLEIGLVVGIVLVLGGALGTVFAVRRWQQSGFGELDVRESLRTVIPAATALALGTQTLLSSFFLSVLGLRRD